nr:helix-turn-helix transcriptional regulator [Neobacillus mesonae]
MKELLDRRNLSQVELAEITGLSVKYINDKANDRGPRGMELANAKLVALALDCSIEDLYEWIVIP